jgi:hypothetical protein
MDINNIYFYLLLGVFLYFLFTCIINKYLGNQENLQQTQIITDLTDTNTSVGGLAVANNTIINNNLNANSNTNLGNLNIKGESKIKNANINGTLNLKGNANIKGTLQDLNTDKLTIANKWTLADTGDNWLRIYGATNSTSSTYYGGFAAGKLWTHSGTINDRNIFNEFSEIENRLNILNDYFNGNSPIKLRKLNDRDKDRYFIGQSADWDEPYRPQGNSQYTPWYMEIKR